MASFDSIASVVDNSGAAQPLYRLDQTDSGRAGVGGVDRSYLEIVHCYQGALTIKIQW